MKVLDSGFTKLITVHNEKGVNVCTSFHDSLSNSRLDISLRTKNYQSHSGVQEKVKNHQSH